jgi:hypothetical protein
MVLSPRRLLVLASLQACTVATLGCAHNFSHIQIRGYDKPQVRSDPNKPIKLRETFAVIARPDLEGTDARLLEKQVLYLAAYGLEAFGFRHVDVSDHPDMLLTTNFSNELQEVYVPPQFYTYPVYRPGQTVTAAAAATSYSPYSGTFYGAAAAASATTPGQWESRLGVAPGYYDRWYAPMIAMGLFDAVSSEELWFASNSGVSNMSNFSVTAPFLLAGIVDRVPICHSHPRLDEILSRKLGVVNCSCWPLSRDGSSYYPTVMHVATGSAARRAGLRMWDMIVEINGRSTANMRARDFDDEILGMIGNKLNLSVARLNKRFQITLQLEPIDTMYSKLIRERIDRS